MTDAEIAARAYNPVGWAWYDAADPDHPAKPIFYERELRQIADAISAYERARPPLEDVIRAAMIVAHTVGYDEEATASHIASAIYPGRA